MLFQSASFKNQIWMISSLSMLIISIVSAGFIFEAHFSHNGDLLVYGILLIILIVSIVGIRIFLEISLVDIKKISTNIRNKVINEKKDIISIKNSLHGFIDLTGKELDDLRETEGLIFNVNSLLKITLENAEECKKYANKVDSDVSDGHDIMKNMVKSVEMISKTKDDFLEILTLIKTISQETLAIHKIVSTTELLSLNASIEAAKAGETGRGFSVVAEEVGILAKDSGREAKEIESIVEEGQNKINSLVGSNQQRLDLGHQASLDALAVFANIKEAMFGISNRSENIRSTTTDQEIAIAQVERSSEEIRSSLKKNIADLILLERLSTLTEKNFIDIKDLSDLIQEFISAS